MSNWVPALITGGLAALTAVFLAIWNRWQQNTRDDRLGEQKVAVETRLKYLEREIEAKAAEDAAFRAYRYKALDRLYSQVNPLIFQLRELCAGSSNRARRIVSTEIAVQGHHLLTSTQRLFAPMVVVQEIQRHLTAVDLRLDANLSAQYAVAREILWTLHAGVAMAEIEPRIVYRSETSSTDQRQHLTHAHLLRFVDLLTFMEPDGTRRPMKQSELEDCAESKDSTFLKAMKPVQELFHNGGPTTTPVLWRLLLAHAMYLHIFSDLVDRSASTIEEVLPPDIDSFRWPRYEARNFEPERDAAARLVRDRLQKVGVIPVTRQERTP